VPFVGIGNCRERSRHQFAHGAAVAWILLALNDRKFVSPTRSVVFLRWDDAAKDGAARWVRAAPSGQGRETDRPRGPHSFATPGWIHITPSQTRIAVQTSAASLEFFSRDQWTACCGGTRGPYDLAAPRVLRKRQKIKK
jgi:hypothetical protein